MKYGIIILSIFFLTAYNSLSQTKDKSLNSKLALGVKYTPFDYIGGIVMGLELQKNKIGVRLQNEIDISLEQTDSLSFYGDNKKYRTYKYLDISYNIYTNSTIFLGLGWVDRKFNSSGILQKDYGYAVVSVGGEYNLSETIKLGCRGIFPLEKIEKHLDQGFAFPLSISMVYSFK